MQGISALRMSIARRKYGVGLAGANSVGSEKWNEPRDPLEGNHQMDGL